jgi:NADPH:quinone reductase-like Zn-dependent oxidoreductase
MRAAVITEPRGPDVLKVMEVDDPRPGPEDILVDVKATALNRADTLQRQGNYAVPPGVPSDILGLEFAGVVI